MKYGEWGRYEGVRWKSENKAGIFDAGLIAARYVSFSEITVAYGWRSLSGFLSARLINAALYKCIRSKSIYLREKDVYTRFGSDIRMHYECATV